MLINEYIINNSLWYLVNSYNYTKDTWWFKVNPKKIKRIITWNLLEYYLMYYLELAKIPFEADKNNPFREDLGVDILIDNQIALHCKATSIPKMLWQIRNWKELINDLYKYGWYIVIGVINSNLIYNIEKLVDKFLNNWWKFSTNNIEVSIEEILYYIWDNINYDYILPQEHIEQKIDIKWLIDIDTFFDNSYFVKYWENFPWTNFSQWFIEWSYLLRQDFDNNQFLKLIDILK